MWPWDVAGQVQWVGEDDAEHVTARLHSALHHSLATVVVVSPHELRFSVKMFRTGPWDSVTVDEGRIAVSGNYNAIRVTYSGSVRRSCLAAAVVCSSFALPLAVTHALGVGVIAAPAVLLVILAVVARYTFPRWIVRAGRRVRPAG